MTAAALTESTASMRSIINPLVRLKPSLVRCGSSSVFRVESWARVSCSMRGTTSLSLATSKVTNSCFTAPEIRKSVYAEAIAAT